MDENLKPINDKKNQSCINKWWIKATIAPRFQTHTFFFKININYYCKFINNGFDVSWNDLFLSSTHLSKSLLSVLLNLFIQQTWKIKANWLSAGNRFFFPPPNAIISWYCFSGSFFMINDEILLMYWLMSNNGLQSSCTNKIIIFHVWFYNSWLLKQLFLTIPLLFDSIINFLI